MSVRIWSARSSNFRSTYPFSGLPPNGQSSAVGRCRVLRLVSADQATLASGPSGAVLKGAEIDLATAIARRLAGLDIVVCGDNVKANRRVAETIENAVGPSEKQKPRRSRRRKRTTKTPRPP